ncbi:hypothetical protein G4167_00130, partial [Vibrio parahaemolyticus]|nr:hypothetical protein [Vibrio parahaemolyticus]
DLSWLYPLIKTAIAEAALIHTHGNQRKAANILGIHRFTVSAHYHAYSKWKKGRSNKFSTYSSVYLEVIGIKTLMMIVKA